MRSTSPKPISLLSSVPTLWVHLAAIGIPTGFALCLYWLTAAPGLTWAHAGADGGDLLTAALVNGVPHPSGYPLYTLLLQGWLWLGHLIDPQREFAFWGNRLSALCVAGATGFTVATCASLLRDHTGRWLWAMVAGLALAITPLAWSQAVITEVYALHLLLISAMGWAVLTQRWPAVGLGVLMGLGAAHHLTSVLLAPALLYWRLYNRPRQNWLGIILQMGIAALLVALPFYGAIIWRVTSASTPPPIAWGYPRDLSGLWWLISGAAYRSYVFDMTPLQYVGRLASLARLLVEQYTPLGMALVVGGLAVWDRQRPFLRNGALLWILPVSLYAAGYNTTDSYIYLLPVAWVMSLMVGQGLASGNAWLATRWRLAPIMIATLALLAIFIAIPWRLPQFDLRQDHAPDEFLRAAASTFEPGSLIISSADAETFALWYGEWGSGTLANAVPDLIFVNYALYQFGWYRNLMHDLYPEIPMIGVGITEVIEANRALRPIYFTEQLPGLTPAELIPVGAFWRLKTP